MSDAERRKQLEQQTDLILAKINGPDYQRLMKSMGDAMRKAGDRLHDIAAAFERKDRAAVLEHTIKLEGMQKEIEDLDGAVFTLVSVHLKCDLK